MKFIYTKDTHFRFGFTPPVGRKETFDEEIDHKIDYILSYCKGNDIFTWFIAGDVFDIKAPSKYTLSQVSENQNRLRKIKEAGVNIYAISGNHDLPGASMDLYKSSFYYLCVKNGLINDVQGLNQLDNKNIFGIPYYKTKTEVMESLKEANDANANIVLLHEHCVPKKEDLFGANFITYKELASYDNIEVFLCGHLHKGYPTQFNPYNEKQLIINPWNLTRLARDYYSVNDVHTPMFVKYDDRRGVTFKEVLIPVKEFQYAFNIDKLKEAEKDATDISEFMKQIEKFQTDSDLEIDNLPVDVANKVREYLERV